MSSGGLDIQRAWDMEALHGAWPETPDNLFLRRRLIELPSEITGRGASGRVLEVAAAEAVHSCKLNLQGLEATVLEPSPVMLGVARERMAQYGAHLTLVRGIAETLPFRDATFDRVLCDSSIDHLAGPDIGLQEMTRVCKPDGRLVIGVVNYGSLSVRLSRLAYRIGRRLGRFPRDRHLFWDSPVPAEHTFECSYDELMRLCSRYCELDEVVGVSMGWAVPGWGARLERMEPEQAWAWLEWLDSWARRVPRFADYLLTVWRPRPSRARVTSPNGTSFRVAAHDPAYRWKIASEARYWANPPVLPMPEPLPAVTRFYQAQLTGEPGLSWFDDMVKRGPFGTAAMLGSDDANFAAAWQAAGASEHLDVYEVSPGMIRRVRAGLTRPASFVRADLNFAELPAARYDVVWSSGALHHILNLEHLLDQVVRALKPGGLFVLHDYVGETRFEYEPRRLALVNAALAMVPARFRREGIEAITPPGRSYFQSALCAVRAAEVLPLARARFDVVHEGFVGALFPVVPYFFHVDTHALVREAPEVLERVLAAEAEALRDPTIRPCEAYVVFRRR